ncbi:MAG: hypothetical protein LBN42_00400 [Oscillospiraceae bacterium]|jgi:type IV pilus assembly protein PilM|nr:hypothetical protein [Oscillospiraceae bacterium]
MICVDINLNQLKVVRGREHNGRVHIYSEDSREIPTSSVEDGEIKDVQIMAAEINEIIQKEQMKEKDVICSFSSSKIIYRDLTFPAPATKDDWRPIIENIISNSLGTTSDYKITYIIIDSFSAEDGQAMLKVSATACPYSVIDGYTHLFRQAGLKLKNLIVSNNSVTRVITHNKEFFSDQYPLLLVQLSDKFINLNLYDEGALQVSRYINIDPSDYQEGSDYVSLAVFDNVFYLINFWQSQQPDKPIKKIQYYGDVSDAPALTQAFEQQFGIPVEPFARPRGVTVNFGVDFLRCGNITGAFYLIDKKTENVNFLENDDTRTKNDSLKFGLIAAGVAGVFIIGFGIAITALTTIQAGKDKDLSKLKKDYNEMGGAALEARLSDQQGVLDNIQNYLRQVELARTLHQFQPKFGSDVVNSLNQVVYSEAFRDKVYYTQLLNLNQYDLTMTFAIPRTVVEVDGKGSADKLVADFIAALQKQGAFFDIVNNGITTTDMTAGEYYTNSIGQSLTLVNDHIGGLYTFTLNMKVRAGNALTDTVDIIPTLPDNGGNTPVVTTAATTAAEEVPEAPAA